MSSVRAFFSLVFSNHSQVTRPKFMEDLYFANLDRCFLSLGKTIGWRLPPQEYVGRRLNSEIVNR